MRVGHHNVDILAHRLAWFGLHAKRLPPLWDLAGISYPLAGPQGEFIGNMLPGKGLLLMEDLKHLGIRKPLPHVFERSLAFRLQDLLKSERGSITTYAGLLAARATYKHGFNGMWVKTLTVTINSWTHHFTDPGTPGAGSYSNIPSGAALSQTTPGAFNAGFAQPTNPDKAYIVSFSLGNLSDDLNLAILIDLLVAAGNIDTNLNTAQTVNTTALTRNTDGVGVMVFFEATSALSTTASNLQINKYTNQGGTANQSSISNAMVTSAAVPRVPYSTCAPFIALQSGDYGVRSVEEVTFSAAMGGTGKVAIGLCKPLLFVPSLPAGFSAKRDDMSNINGATALALTSGNLIGCLSLLLNTGGGGTAVTNGEIEIAVG